MTFEDCIKFANDNAICYIATMDGDQPRVRAFGMWFADASGFYFCTGTPKAVCQQLKNNSKAEICFYSPEPQPIGKMMRLTGEVEFLHDIELNTKLLEDMPFLKEIGITGPEDPNLAVFRIASGEARFWTMEDEMNREPVEILKF